jgi:lactate dehydrogenase-like 2-hydroxyacid dehydrogenase
VASCFVTRPLPGDAHERLKSDHYVEVWKGRLPPSPADLKVRMRDAEGLLCMLTDRVDAELIEAAPKLRAISNYAVGTDNIDLEAAVARGIPVGRTPDVLTETTADFTFALLLAAARRIVEGEIAVRAGDWITWEPGRWLGHDVHGATLGIVGLGRIGKAVARRAEGFGMRVIHTSHAGGVPLEELLAESDFVSIHLPLTPETHGLIGIEALRAMKPTAILVNTARGKIVDARALETALREGWIAGAALDVTDPEPLPPEHPLLEAPNILVVPHIASASHRTRQAMAEMAVNNLLAGLAGQPMPHSANPQVSG